MGSAGLYYRGTLRERSDENPPRGGREECIGGCALLHVGPSHKGPDTDRVEKKDSGRNTPGPGNRARNMPNFTGTWKMKSSENFDELLKALGEDCFTGDLMEGVWT